MNVRQKRRLLGLAAACLALGAVAVLSAAFVLPVEVPAGGAVAPAGHAVKPAVGGPASPTPTDGIGTTPTLNELRRLTAVDLRRPLFDPAPPPTAAAKAAAKRAPLTIKLIGTVHEPGHSLAMFMVAGGKVELCAVGEKVNDRGGPVTVTHIDSKKVTVQYAGRSHDLAVPLPPGGPTR